MILLLVISGVLLFMLGFCAAMRLCQSVYPCGIHYRGDRPHTHERSTSGNP